MTQKALIGLGTTELIASSFMNIFKTAASTSFTGGALPNVLDLNGYPTAPFTGNISFSIPDVVFTGPWVIQWPATRNFTVKIQHNVTTSASSHATITGGSNSQMTISSDGINAGSVTFSFNTLPGGGVCSCQFPGTGTYAAGTGELAMVRASDLAAYNAGGIFTPEFLACYGGLHPETIRPMGWTGTNNGNLVQWLHRTTPSSFSYAFEVFPPDRWGGTISGTDAYTSAAGTGTPLTGWVAGEVLQGVVTNARTIIQVLGSASGTGGNVQLVVNTTATLTNGQSVWIDNVAGTVEANGVQTILSVDDATHFTLTGVPFVHAWTNNSGNQTNQFVGTQTITVTGKTGGAKFLASLFGRVFGVASSTDGPAAGAIVTMVYDDLLDRVLLTPGTNGGGILQHGGIISGVPCETQASLANSLGANLWINLPTMVNDDFVTNAAATILAALNSNLNCNVEYSNEMWNTAFAGTTWAVQRGAALGFPVGNEEGVMGWYGLRVRQIMPAFKAVWGGNSARVKGVMAFQCFGTSSHITTYRCNGTDLDTTKGYTKYNSYIGQNYHAYPNRPFDVCDILSYAPYFMGANYTSNGSAGNTYVAANATALTTVINQYFNGDTAGALAWLDNDIRLGQVSGVLSSFTMGGLVQNILPQWETLAASYDASGRASPLTIQCYEGGLSCVAPTSTQCTNLGITVSGQTAAQVAALFAQMLVDYKNSQLSLQLVCSHFSQVMAIGSHSAAPAWLITLGGGEWALLPGDCNSTPYQTYYGFGIWSEGRRRMVVKT